MPTLTSDAPVLRAPSALATDAPLASPCVKDPAEPAAKDYFAAGATAALTQLHGTSPILPRPFGVEIEMANTTLWHVSRVLQRTLPGKAPENDDVYDAFNRRWEVKLDEPNIEIATPILRSQDDLATLQRVVTALAESGVACDNNTGVHVHVDADAIDTPNLTYLLALVARHEPYIFSALQVEPLRRQTYCRPLTLAHVKRAVSAEPQNISALAAAFRGNAYTAKFVGVNLEPLFSEGGFGTVEFRYFNGCLEPHAIGCYVGYAMALMHHAATQPAAPAPEAAATLPGFLRTLGLGPAHPVSRMLCEQLQHNLETSIDEHPVLSMLVREQHYTGDAALLLTMGVPAAALETALTSDADPAALFHRAVSFLRYLPIEASKFGFERLCQEPTAHQAELVTLARDLLNAPRFASEATRVFSQLCRVPQPLRAQWVRSAKRAPVPVLLRFSPKATSPLASIFSKMGLAETEFQGVLKLAQKALNLYHRSPQIIKARLDAVADTGWQRIDDPDLRGRVMTCLLDLEPENIKRLATLTEHLLSCLLCNNSYLSLLEAFCTASPERWGAYATRLETLLNGPDAHNMLFALRYNFHDATAMLEGVEMDAELADALAF